MVRHEFREEVLDFLWRQWTQLGVSGVAHDRDEWAIDPEALLVYSLAAARRDPRLFDEILDWLVSNASIVSTQRIRNLLDPDHDPIVRASLAWASAQGAPPFRSWQEADPSSAVSRRHLFRIDGRPLHIEVADPHFEPFGLLRPVAHRSRKSQAPDPTVPANFAVRLRLMFGVGSRAELLRLLLTAGSGMSTGRLAELAAYARRNVADVLAALDEAGAVMSAMVGRSREWRVDRRRWAELFGFVPDGFPRFVDWIGFLRMLRRIDDWFDADAVEDRTDYLRASTARQLVEELRNDLVIAGIDVPGRVDVSNSLPALDGVVGSLLGVLRGRAPG